MESKENTKANETAEIDEMRETYINPRLSPEDKKKLEEDLNKLKLDENTNLTEVN
jgi:hypothetical protein